MVSSREAKRRKSTAKRTAQNRSSGFQNTTVRLPDNVEWFAPKKGTHNIAILGFTAGENNPMARKGEFHFERTFYVYKNVGPEENWYVAPCKMGFRDPIQEWRAEEAKSPDGDADKVKDLTPKERQLYLIWDYADDKLKIWDISYNLFGELLYKRFNSEKGEREGWDLFYFHDEDGMDLEIEMDEAKRGKWLETTSIDFIPRKAALPKQVSDHGVCLDDLIIVPTYEELKKHFFGLDVTRDEENDADDDADDEPVVSRHEEVEEEPEPTPKKSRRVEADEEPEPAPKKEKAAQPVASDYGIEAGMKVLYKGQAATVMKVSGDGTSLLLEIDETEELERGVGPDEVTISKAKTKESKPKPKKEKVEEAPFEDDEPAPAPAKSKKKEVDDEWDF